jgi:hypothetical protein
MVLLLSSVTNLLLNTKFFSQVRPAAISSLAEGVRFRSFPAAVHVETDNAIKRTCTEFGAGMKTDD